MKTTPRPFLPPVPVGIKDPIVLRYLQELQRAMQGISIDVYIDLTATAVTDPPAGMKKITNIYYNPTTGLFAFTYEA